MKCKVFKIRLSEGHVERDVSILNDFLESVEVRRMSSSIVNANVPFWSVLVFYKEGDLTSHAIPTEDITLADFEERIYEALRDWRNEQAAKENIPPYMVAHNHWLKQMVRMRVKEEEDLLGIKGFGKKRITKYGNDIIKIMTPFYETGGGCQRGKQE